MATAAEVLTKAIVTAAEIVEVVATAAESMAEVVATTTEGHVSARLPCYRPLPSAVPLPPLSRA